MSPQKKLLVVEDNPINQQVVCRFLDKSGYSYDIAANGKDAVEMYTSNFSGYALILMDCQMPVMDGYEASIKIREIESISNRQHIPIIAMTAYAQDSDKQKCLDAGMSDYIKKPIQRRILLTMLQKWTSQ